MGRKPLPKQEVDRRAEVKKYQQQRRELSKQWIREATIIFDVSMKKKQEVLDVFWPKTKRGQGRIFQRVAGEDDDDLEDDPPSTNNLGRFLAHLSPEEIAARRSEHEIGDDLILEREIQQQVFEQQALQAARSREDAACAMSEMPMEDFRKATIKISSNTRYEKAREQVLNTPFFKEVNKFHSWTLEGMLLWIKDGRNNKRSNNTIATICSAFVHLQNTENGLSLVSDDDKKRLSAARKARANLVPDLPKRVGAITKARLRQVHSTYDFHLQRGDISASTHFLLKDASTMMYACALRLFQLQQLTRDSFTFTSDGQKMYVTCNVKKTNSSSKTIELKEVHPDFVDEVKKIIQRRRLLTDDSKSFLLFFEFLTPKAQQLLTRKIAREVALVKRVKKDQRRSTKSDSDDEASNSDTASDEESRDELDEILESFEDAKGDDEDEDDDDEGDKVLSNTSISKGPPATWRTKHPVDLMKLFNAETAEIFLWPMALAFHGTHNFRHGAAQDAFEEGGLELVMLRTGHESEACAKHYATHDQARTKAVQNNLEKYNDPQVWIDDIRSKLDNRVKRGEILLRQDVRQTILGLTEHQQHLQQSTLEQQYQTTLLEIETKRDFYLAGNNNNNNSSNSNLQATLLGSDAEPVRASSTDQSSAEQQRLPVNFQKLVDDHVRLLEDRNTALSCQLQKALSELELLKRMNSRMLRQQVKSELPARNGRDEESISVEEFQNRLRSFKGVPVFLIKKSIARAVAQKLEVFAVSTLDFSRDYDLIYTRPVCLHEGTARMRQLDSCLIFAGTNYKTVEEESRALGSLKIRIN